MLHRGKSRRRKYLSCVVLVVTLALLVGPAPAAAQGHGGSTDDPPSFQPTQADVRFFPETSFRIDNDRFFDFFQKRGGVRTFGFPVSRQFTLLGTTVQFFQRRVMQIQPDGSVDLLNVLDPAILPVNSVNFATFPAFDPGLVSSAPPPGSPQILGFVQANAPESFEGLPVGFFRNFLATVSCAAAFPNQPCQSGLLPGFDLQMWGVPTSAAAFDPNNHNFVFLRFQRGIVMFDNTVGGVTEGVLMGDAFKSVITGQNLPQDLAIQTAGSRFANQWNNSQPLGLNRPNELPNTDMTNAFVLQVPAAPPGGGLRLGMQAFLFGQPIDRNLDIMLSAGFPWLKIQVPWSQFEPSPGNINFGPLDAIVERAAARGMPVLFSVVTSPTWARADQLTHAPPDDPATYSRFVAILAARYAGRVRAYEIWNEQNLVREWASGLDPNAYIDLLKVAFAGIKAADPSAIVVSGALTPTGVNDPGVAIDDLTYLTGMETAQGGVFRDIADAVGAHSAGFNNAPRDFLDVHTVNTPGFKDDASFYFRRIDQLHQVLTGNSDSRRLFITEYEWAQAEPPVPPGYEWATDLSVDQVASFYVQGIQDIIASKPWVGMVIVWNLNWRTFADFHTNEQAIFGILNPDFTPRPIYTALHDMPKPSPPVLGP